MRTDLTLRHIVIGMIASLACSAALAADWQIADLMQLLSHNRSGHATFVEKKYIGIVDKPVESTGELFYTAPDRLEKRTLRPRFESMQLEGPRMILDRAGKARQSITVADYPEAAAFVESIRSTLAGDRVALEKWFRVSLGGTSDKWQLLLLPRYSRMTDLITRIVIAGSNGEILRVDFDLADGDRTEMLITRVAQ